MEYFHAEIVVKLKQHFKQQAVKAQDIPFRADVIGNLHLQQGFLKDVKLRLVNRAASGIFQNKLQLGHIGDVEPDEVKGYLKDDPGVWGGAFGRMDDAGVD
ncbi:hypothetical protein IMSAGC009_00113 [Lachnospiraceae bacterium]|nr:hypothetical protein IMSAGC009_00113 [Lachnospiraceae bacterium]